MAKDVLLNVRSGDALFDDGARRIDYLEVVCGRVFSTDNDFYLNIVVPRNRLNQIKFEDDVLNLYVHIPYTADCQIFNVRLITIGGDSQYHELSLSYHEICREYPVYWSKNIESEPVRVAMSELPLINIDGNFLVSIRNNKDELYRAAYIYSAYRSDFMIGTADEQSAQLLSICAPGKHYRYPTSGVDVTNYINSIVANTDFAKKLSEEFEKDSKTISDAIFDSDNGNLDLVFSSANEAEDTGLESIDDLDMSVFDLADDDYVKSLVGLLSEDDAIDPELALFSFENLDNVWGVFCLNDSHTERRYDGVIRGKQIAIKNGKYWDRDDYLTVKVTLKSGTMLQFRGYGGGMGEMDCPVPFVLDKGGVTIYRHPPLTVDSKWWNNGARLSAIVLTDCVMRYSIHNWAFESGYGVYLVEPDKDFLKDFLVVTLNKVASKMIGYVTNPTNIKSIKLGRDTGRIYVVKN